MQKSLCEFVAHTTEFETPDDSGQSAHEAARLQRLSLERTGRYTKEQLDERFAYLVPPPILGFPHLIQLLRAVYRCRPAAMEGIAPLSPTELQAYIQVTDTPLSGFEADTIFLMDDAFMAAISKVKAKKD